MTLRRTPPSRAKSGQRDGGYIIVLFVIILAFVMVAAAMQVLVLTAVGTTSRAFDSYRQGAAEMVRLDRAVNETMAQLGEVSIATPPRDIGATLSNQLQSMAAGGATITVTSVPGSLPAIVTYPSSTLPPDGLAAVPQDMQPYLTPELMSLMGPRVAAYSAVAFQFSSTRTILSNERTFSTEVDARFVAVPLTRFPIAAYDLPSEVGSIVLVANPAPASSLPAGLVPSRDPAFSHDLQARSGVLPYHYRRRALLAAAYQYIFAQPYIDRVAEYAGVTHYRDMDTAGSTAVLAGMNVSGTVSSWDLGQAGNGTYNTVTLYKDATVIFTQQGGKTLHLYDSIGDANAPAMMILALGPADRTAGNLTLDFASVTRPVVIIGYNVRVTSAPATGVNGALLLDPASSIDPSTTLSVGHLSYWAGSASIPLNTVTATAMPLAAEAMAPRVVYVATKASRL